MSDLSTQLKVRGISTLSLLSGGRVVERDGGGFDGVAGDAVVVGLIAVVTARRICGSRASVFHYSTCCRRNAIRRVDKVGRLEISGFRLGRTGTSR